MNEIQDRIFLLVKTKNFTSAEFADAIGVQPSNISHIMSGRNKPSLDLVMKVLKKFPEIRSEWLINGVGSMTKDYSLVNEEDKGKAEKKIINTIQQALLFDQVGESTNSKMQIEEEKGKIEVTEKAETENEISENPFLTEKLPENHHQERKKIDPHRNTFKKIEKIVVFYEDRTFREYSPED
jgi:transcriptional regulator with XRE-family HTH domain